MMYTRWNTYSSYLKEKYGEPLFRIGVDASLSCPNRDASRHGGCAFCDGTGAVAAYQRASESMFKRTSEYDDGVASSVLPKVLPIKDQVERGRAFLQRRYKARLFALSFQSWTNTYAPVEKLKAIYDEGLSLLPFKELIVSTRPDCVDEPVLSLLESYLDRGLDVWLELGLQSASDETLRVINRGHGSAEYIDAAERAHNHNLKIATHIILGLPGEGRDDFVRTAQLLNEAGSDAVKIHNLQVTGGTYFSDAYLSGMFTVMSEERTLEATELFLRHLDSSIIIERLLSETPYHRLLAPRVFPDKSKFLARLSERMERNGTRQGDLA